MQPQLSRPSRVKSAARKGSKHGNSRDKRLKCAVWKRPRGHHFPLLGDDVVRAGGGNDSVYARSSSAPAGVSEGNDSFYGEAGDDLLSAYGGLGNQLLDGGAGNDTLTGGTVSDTLIGGGGNDYLSNYTSTDEDLLDGGTGDDSFSEERRPTR